MQPNSRYTYRDAGFNSFLLRSLKSNRSATSLSEGISIGSTNISFDKLQVEGSLGDKFDVGTILIDGRRGRIDMRTSDLSDTLIRLGELDD